jgi:hypothetical protein
MRRHLRLLFLSLLLVVAVADLPEQAASQSPDRELVSYVQDSSNPSYLVLSGGFAVAVNNRTQFWIQPPRGSKRRKGSMNDVRVEQRVLIFLGPDDVAKSVTVFERQ